MTKYIYSFIFALILGVFGYAYYQHKQAVKYQALYEVALSNNKAYESDLAKNAEKVRAYQLTLQDLETSNDSLVQELIKVQKERKIKDSELQAMAYQLSKVTRRDTITMKDTIFVENFKMDTTLVDKWYKLDMSMSYPSTISVAPTFNSERYIIVNTRKEIIGKPSKIFFIRWFQKKHRILEVNVEEKNPYIEVEQQKFIKVL